MSTKAQLQLREFARKDLEALNSPSSSKKEDTSSATLDTAQQDPKSDNIFPGTELGTDIDNFNNLHGLAKLEQLLQNTDLEVPIGSYSGAEIKTIRAMERLNEKSDQQVVLLIFHPSNATSLYRRVHITFIIRIKCGCFIYIFQPNPTCSFPPSSYGPEVPAKHEAWTAIDILYMYEDKSRF